MHHRVVDLLCEYLENPLAVDCPNPRLSWKLLSDRPNCKQEAYQVQVASKTELLDVGNSNLWDSGEVPSNHSLDIKYEGETLQSTDQAFWRIRSKAFGEWSDWTEAALWECAIIDRNRWHSMWISFPFSGDWTLKQPAQIVRKEFILPQSRIYRARLTVSAKGLVKPFLNGEWASDAEFLPGWTDYNRRIPYETIDVTKLLNPGRNVIGGLLGDGWFCGQVCWFGRNQYGNYPMGLLRLSIEFEDREPMLIGSDSTWKSAESGIRSNDLIQGECFDGSNSFVEALSAEFDDSNWQNVRAASLGQVPLVPRISPPCRVTERLEPVEILEVSETRRIYDFGQNHAGNLELSAGDIKISELTIRHAEVLDSAGELYVENLRAATATDTVSNLDATQHWCPQFTFHGYRYAEIESSDPDEFPTTITSRVIHSDLKRTGWFSCSDPVLTRLYENIVWGLRSNFVDVPTDCPQRDERLGWTGDAQVFASTAGYIYDVGAFFENWIEDVISAAAHSGIYPNIAPNLLELGQGAPGWADAGVLVPFSLFQTYGNTDHVAKCLPTMERYVRTILKANPDGLWKNLRSHDFGDWLSIGADTDKTLIATAFLINNLRLLSLRAGINLLPEWRSSMEVFEREFMEKGRLKHETQTGYALILAFRIGHPKTWPATAAHLARLIETNGNQISTGFLGVNHLLGVLAEFGFFDACYKLLLRKEFPSWLYPVTRGATTIWERWDGWTEETGFQDPGMNSFNHYAYGSVGQWLFEHIGGIQPLTDHPGFSHFRMAPTPGGDLAWAKVRFDSRYGTIQSDWKYGLDGFSWEIEIPPNSSAEVLLPPLESNCAWLLDGIPFKTRNSNYGGSGRRSLILNSGKYQLSSQ
jgi:alpha-L-rhamnosidase